MKFDGECISLLYDRWEQPGRDGVRASLNLNLEVKAK